jgi:hypothetical protein
LGRRVDWYNLQDKRFQITPPEPRNEPARQVVAVTKSFTRDVGTERGVKTVSGLITALPNPMHRANNMVVQALVRFEGPDCCYGIASRRKVDPAMLRRKVNNTFHKPPLMDERRSDIVLQSGRRFIDHFDEPLIIQILERLEASRLYGDDPSAAIFGRSVAIGEFDFPAQSRTGPRAVFGDSVSCVSGQVIWASMHGRDRARESRWRVGPVDVTSCCVVREDFHNCCVHSAGETRKTFGDRAPECRIQCERIDQCVHDVGVGYGHGGQLPCIVKHRMWLDLFNLQLFFEPSPGIPVKFGQD